MISIYTSAYNLENSIYDWKEALNSFAAFADEVVISTFQIQKDNTVKLLQDYIANNHKFKLILCDLTQDDPEFDGKLKNEALKQCTKDFCILLDLDEKIPLWQRSGWEFVAKRLGESDYDAIMIPVVDLYNTEEEYKSIGYKWYLHKNHIGLERGVVRFARKPDGFIDTNKSDTTELVKYGNLCNAAYLIDPRLEDEKKLQIMRQNSIYVLHYGWLDKDKRKLANQFWQPVWSNRSGSNVDTSVDFASISYKKHELIITK
jgi:hypothetical protein